MHRSLGALGLIAAASLLSSCSNGSGPSATLTLAPNGTVQVTGPMTFVATPTPAGTPVTWSLRGAGTLSGTTGDEVVYRPPAAPSPGMTVTLTASAGGSEASASLVLGPAGYLQVVSVAKTVLDPADPVNFAGHLTTDTLPNLLANPDGSVAQTPKAILSQIAFCDQTIPNPFNFLWASTLGTAPQPPAPGFGGPGNAQLFYRDTGSAPDLASCPAPGGAPIPAGAVNHGFLLDWSDVAIASRAQADAVAFALARTLPASLVVLP